ncbi:hypothetical protein [uncultured Nitratireductor sp.]|uniref:hypothetical protein n=1 Tax=uncultured Nitratireductor sp. TaxID=520953 RepID=UPI00262CE2F1|nr:hypothetical protein [uncultured Nitratireductor sp.]
MHSTTNLPERLKDFLRVATPALAMPLAFTAIPGWITNDADLLRLSWSVIAPSSLAGALLAVYLRPLAATLNRLLHRFSKIAVAAFGGAIIAFGVLIPAHLAALAGLLSLALGTNCTMSAGIGAFAAILTAFPTDK